MFLAFGKPATLSRRSEARAVNARLPGANKVEIHLFGGCRLKLQGRSPRSLNVAAPRQRALIAYLALQPQPVSRDRPEAMR
jgi:hypothetical protein